MRKFKQFFLWSISFLVIFGCIIVLAFQLSPRPGAFLIGQLFNGNIKITDKVSYKKSVTNVTVKKDLVYQSKYKKNTFDLYYPKEMENSVPIVFWVHGGGYVGGDKEGVKEYATYLADKAQVAVISLNYEWAPSLNYPGQVKQIEQAYHSIKMKTTEYPMLDFNKVIFGGDSAGAQIAGQFLSIQTNLDYANSMRMKQVIPQNNIKGFISYCGPVDLKEIKQQSSDKWFMKFFVNTVAWSLLGQKDWKDSSELNEASLVDKLTNNFPPTYISDGNAYSFQDQGIAFASRLKALSIPVESLFYKDDEKKVTHEYQFDYSTLDAKNCLEETIKFVKEVINS
ncbi:hypothetical protein A5819_001828 [Enterococcus sp. 7E2_DIV0204]|uniref:alpha/beta hydrolase n=1 Tax=Enterococcus sp. 7E2_DIV0204 TaxID=1834188 RepID=UPI000A34048E|nr:MULTISPECIES: alpha/beta hydrolase fold domain-containing protein [unclassified Enterococcus]OTN89336.1 hypothetical protein A5819_001828 [Enterococcus sp. 7E2_DIV0204]OTP51789.1 hypothetical protein A5884_000984 [Enterococcus sp. 7D2_DIV0200]